MIRMRKNIFLGNVVKLHIGGNMEDCRISDIHCHDSIDRCIEFVKDCEEHSFKCTYSCHEECNCQDFGG